MKKLPLGIQSFREIIESGYIYVDKTRYIYELITNAKHYFLSRPRRFGKSLLLDTIAELFSGDRALFKELWINNSDYSFEMHPVLHIDLSSIANKTPDILENELSIALEKRAKQESIGISGSTPSAKLKALIEALNNKYGKRVVVLIDEYDKPILDHISDADTAEANRAVLRGFYGILKSMDPHLKLTLVTGVTKFTKTSLFSEMNNLLDITLSEKYANICGIPTEDLGELFQEHIEYLSSLEKFRLFQNLHDEILAWYDGYSWDGVTKVLNPFGLFSFIMQERFSSFWYSSGSPKFLMDLIKQNPEAYANIRDLKIRELTLDIFDIRNLQAAPLLFQTGYLTIKEVVNSTGFDSTAYILGTPNREVREELTKLCSLSLGETR